MHRIARWSIWSLLVGVAACGTSPARKVVPHEPAAVAASEPAAPAPDPAPPELRLPEVAKPLRYDVELALDPSREDFSGTIAIELEVLAPTTALWLDADEITVERATFEVGGERIPARPISTKQDFLGLVPARALAPGRATLRIAYQGKMHRGDGTGIYTMQDNGLTYAVTQFEATDAREAFPCFDEPSYKVPWKLAIRAPQGLVALANTPVESETVEPGGTKLVRFAETKPLPSYLVAFAVGPFDIVDAGKTRTGAPIRIVVPRGRANDAAYPVEVTGQLLAVLEDYFGTPYPFEKLDMIAVPVFNAGAMENPGLITYRQELMLSRPSELTLEKQKAFAGVASHELAHQWFGNLVTLAWWDDTWLNEAFATWMTAKVIEAWKPSWDVPVELVARKGGVMGADSLDAARAVRQPIESANDIANAFDGITYGKGAAVLAMLERWIGPEVFRAGVRAYLAKHAWKNATYGDFVGAMTTAAGKDVTSVFDGLVLQSGVPLVDVELACAAGGPKLRLAQRRYVPTGSSADPKRTWKLPMCVAWEAGGVRGHDCTVLDGERAELALSAKSCPTWVLPNEGGIGYYRTRPAGKLLDRLLANAGKLTLPERVGLIGDVNALVASGDVDIKVALAMMDKLAKDRSRHLVDASIELIARLEEMVTPKLEENYARLIRKLYRARAKELGWTRRPTDDDTTKLLRPRLLGLVAGAGNDPELVAQATQQAWRWLDDRTAVDPDLVRTTLAVAARHGDRKLFDRLHAAAKATSDRIDRGQLLAAMAGFTDPQIVARALELVLTDEFELRESIGLLQQAFAHRTTRPIAYQFVVDHFDAIAAKLPEPFRPYLAFTVVALCDDSRRIEVEAFFRPRIEKLDGGPRVMEQALEQLSLCSAARKAQSPSVIAFLQRQ